MRYIYNFIREHWILILQGIPALAIFLLATYRLSGTGQPIIFNDEIGYWSNAAFFMGDDWTAVTNRISYYSYGYSLLLIPLRLLASWRGWNWRILYHAGVVLNGVLLAGGYVIALKLAKRYLPEMNRLVRTVACFAVFTYSTYIVYAHITWAECALAFFFWVWLYIMMRLMDRPTVWNHVAFAVVSFYIYTVHQRALGIVVSAVLIVLCVRLLRWNRLRDTAAFLGCMYLCGLGHSMVKWNLQHVNYLGEEPVGIRELIGHAFTGASGLFLAAGILLVLLLYIIEKRKYKILLAVLAGGILLGIGVARHYGFGVAVIAGIAGKQMTEITSERITVNDFSGQMGVLRNLFTVNGLLRLGISILGKWFYLASTSGFVICWGIAGLFKNAFLLLRDGLRRMSNLCRHREEKAEEKNIASPKRKMAERERIFFLGVLAAWFSTFMVSAIYKEGFYKIDDLFNGRYVEFTIGFLLLYSLNLLINDKKWVRKVLLVMVLYIAAGHFCQYALNELGRTQFEQIHCVMFGRMIWNYEVPAGKMRVVEEHIFPFAIGFFVVLKLMRERFPKAAVVRTVLALMIPVAAWSYLGKTIVDNYVVVRNEKQELVLPQFADWIKVLGKKEGQKIYYVLNSARRRRAGTLQFMLPEQPVTPVWLSEVSFTEDAFYVVHLNYMDEEKITENCWAIETAGEYMLLINRNQELMENWKPFMD